MINFFIAAAIAWFFGGFVSLIANAHFGINWAVFWACMGLPMFILCASIADRLSVTTPIERKE